MAGGVMNIAFTGQQNEFLTGNPSKSLFKGKYAQYTNFGLQKFRVDFDGTKMLRMTEPSVFTFKIPRYGDLVMGSYLSVTLPHIWSPIYPPQKVDDGTSDISVYTPWSPYEYKWIEHLGAKMISKISIVCGNATIQEYSGDYLLASVQRDFSEKKQALFNEMTGHTPPLFDPAFHPNSGENGQYPNAFYTENSAGSEPSIRGRVLYIPINSWFCMNSQQAFPLIALQHNELKINVEFHPINTMFRIRDILDFENGNPYIAPNINAPHSQFFRFIQPPPSQQLNVHDYDDTRTLWNADVHLVCTYAFLSECEREIFTESNGRYVMRQIREKQFHNVTGTNKVQLDSHGMVSSYMFYFRRSDVNLRNEWSNYSNWPYNKKNPVDLENAPDTGTVMTEAGMIGPGINPDGSPTGLQITGTYNPENEQGIMINFGIQLDGTYREDVQPVGIYDYVEKYVNTPGNAPSGLYCYNFCLNSSPFIVSPSGAINMSKFSKIEFEFSTIIPPVDPLAQSLNICDPETGDTIGVNKSTWDVYKYNYDLTVFEERMNIVEFMGGNCGLIWAQ
jgi:hypothetical protein